MSILSVVVIGCGSNSDVGAGSTGTGSVPPPEVGTLEAFATLTGSSEGLAFGPGPDGTTVLYVGSRDGHIARVGADGSVTEHVALPRPVGIALGADGNLIVCGSASDAEDAPTVLWRVTPKGEKSVLVDGGSEPFQQTNFVAVSADGSLLFTDSKANRIYRADGDGKNLALVTDAVSFPNGITFSKDAATAYVASWDAKKVMAFPVAQDGSYGVPSVFSDDVDSVDGLATFANGELLYVATGDGVLRYAADHSTTTYAKGPPLGIPANGAFGVGAFGGEWVYVTSLINKTVWRVYVGDTGVALPP
ncbi:MAG: SMP-30/gluconolactonase/LRE family protein [Deltaproteobacteria bacterium]|nr:SMP-30/gluconolactonase/LRE family protein [Deltaproteobacteria bacterium]